MVINHLAFSLNLTNEKTKTMKNKITLLFLQSIILITLSINALSQPATSLIKVIVASDHKDWTYKVNEEAKFSVQVLKYGNLMENVTIDYEAGPEMLPDIKKEGVVLKDWKNRIYRYNESSRILPCKGLGSC